MLYQDLIEDKLSQYGYNYEVRKGSIIILYPYWLNLSSIKS
jgi:hypothetical protein